MSTAAQGRAREEWRRLDRFPGYEVSSEGQVRSWLRWKGQPVPRILRQSSNPDGYLLVRPTGPEGQKSVTVHALVAEAFFGPRPSGMQILHGNGVKTDNRAANLRYGTRSENAADAVQHGQHFPSYLTHCRRAGHPLFGDNLYLHPSGKRQCRACNNARRTAKRAGGKR